VPQHGVTFIYISKLRFPCPPSHDRTLLRPLLSIHSLAPTSSHHFCYSSSSYPSPRAHLLQLSSVSSTSNLHYSYLIHNVLLRLNNKSSTTNRVQQPTQSTNQPTQPLLVTTPTPTTSFGNNRTFTSRKDGVHHYGTPGLRPISIHPSSPSLPQSKSREEVSVSLSKSIQLEESALSKDVKEGKTYVQCFVVCLPKLMFRLTLSYL
jgi:hypothetical protein